jgi:hypothetical protein
MRWVVGPVIFSIQMPWFSWRANKLGLGVDFSKLHLLPVHGKSRGKYYLEVWLAATKAAGTPYYFILDKGAGKEAKKFLSNGTLKYGENFFLLQGELEDYYPVDVLITSLEKEYTLSLSEDEKAKISKGRRSKEIEAILKRKKRVFPST